MKEQLVVKYRAPVDDAQLELAALSFKRNEAITPRVGELANRVIEIYEPGKHQQSLEDIYLEIFTSGDYYFYDMIDFTRVITKNQCLISYSSYPWFKDLVEQMFDYLNMARKL